MSTAILFYGYNLGELAGFDHPFEDAEWFKEADESEFLREIRSALLAASGIDVLDDPYRNQTPYEDDALLSSRCGLEVLYYGHSNTEFYGLALAGAVHRADDWSPKGELDLKVPQMVELRVDGETKTRRPSRDVLREGLMVLGIKEPDEPSWILAPVE